MFEKIIEADAMLRRDWEKIAEAKRVKFMRQTLSRGAVDLVHRQCHRLANPPQYFRQLAIGARLTNAPDGPCSTMNCSPA